VRFLLDSSVESKSAVASELGGVRERQSSLIEASPTLARLTKAAHPQRHLEPRNLFPEASSTPVPKPHITHSTPVTLSKYTHAHTIEVDRLTPIVQPTDRQHGLLSIRVNSIFSSSYTRHSRSAESHSAIFDETPDSTRQF